MVKLTLSFKGRILKVYYPQGERVLIGRSPDCDIQIENLAVHPIHARLSLEEDKAVLFNNADESTIAVNGEPVEQHLLNDGDVIELGKYTVTFAYDTAASSRPEAEPQVAAEAPTGWLQFMNGPKLGRTIRLDRNLVRLGKSGEQSAMIASREDGYYISHLEGDRPTRVQEQPLGEDSRKLQEGDTIQIGETRILFFLEEQ